MKRIDLEYFKILCETKSFTTAAQVCCVSQPKMTIAIKKLEEEFGTKLILRERFSDMIRITQKGKAVLEFIEYFKVELKKLEIEIGGEVLKIGIPCIEEIVIIKNHLRNMYETDLEKMRLVGLKKDKLKDEDVFQKVDCYLMYYRKNERQSNRKKMFLKEIFLEIKYNSKLDINGVEMLNGATIITLNKKTFHYEVLQDVLKVYNIKPKRILVVDSLDAAQMLIEENLGVGIFFEELFKGNKKIKTKKIKEEPIECYLEYIDDEVLKKVKIENLRR